MTTVIFRTATKFVVPLIMLVSIALFLQGHNQPGGGFIGGVLTAIAFGLIYIAYGLDFLEEDVLGREFEATVEHLRHGVVVEYRRLFALGIGLALLAGIFVMVLDLPFLTQGYTILHDVPLYGEIEIASALVFDLGVYMVVVGSLLTILSVVGTE